MSVHPQAPFDPAKKLNTGMSTASHPQIDTPRWLAVAFAELGVSPYPVGSCNPRITQYHKDTNISGYDDKVSWCSSFIHWTLAQVDIVGTGSALARSWLHWGEELNLPVIGCIAVLWRDDPTSWKGHVGYYLREDDEYVYLLGGNQLDQVREHFYPKSSVLSYRWPSDVSEIHALS
jgi:uncharacterized protein (TIGR02594 family)